MNNELETTEYLQKLSNLKLSDSSHARIKSNLLEYAKFHTVRVAGDSRSNSKVQTRTSLFAFKFTYMPFIILFALIVGGGTTFAAQGAIPGDFLYPIKTEVNEPVRSAFAFSADAEANLQASIVAERISEAEELETEGRLDTDTSAKLSANLQSHMAKAEEAMIKSDDNVRVSTHAKIDLAIARFNVLVKNDTALAIAVPGTTSTSETSTVAVTTLATRKMSPEALRTQTVARVTNLSKVVTESKAKISAKVYADIKVKLDEADKLVLESKTEAELESQQNLMKAAGLAGEVESTLSLLGTAETDPNTGAIINIDFDNVPPKHIESETSASDTSTNSDSDTGVAADANIQLQRVEGSEGNGGGASSSASVDIKI